MLGNIFYLAQDIPDRLYLFFSWCGLCVCVCVRVEEAEGVGEPCDTNKLQMNPCCSDSKLLRGLWATALLLGPKGRYHFSIYFSKFIIMMPADDGDEESWW